MSRRPRGLRAEVPALLAGSLLVFVALATLTLVSYRAAIAALVLERRGEAERLATRLADQLARPNPPAFDALARALPPGAAVALFDGLGAPLATHGFEDAVGLAIGDFDLAAPRFTVAGPQEVERRSVVAVAPFASAAGPRLLRVDLPAGQLAARSRGLAILTPLVLTLALAATALLLLFARALARPYDELLARARRAVGDPSAAESDDEFLVSTFDRALAALQTSPAGEIEALDQVLGRHVESGFLLLDPAGRVLALNAVAGDLLGAPGDLVGAPLERAFAEQPELRALLSQAIETGSSMPRGEARLRRAGIDTPLGVVVEALRRPGGDLRGFLVLFADLTDLDRSAARERLADTLAQLGELAAGVAHELRNGLATLTGYLELARRRVTDSTAAEHLEEAQREIGELRRVVGDFLAFARPGTGRVERLDLAALVARACRDPALGAVPVRFAAPDSPCPLRGDEQLLIRAIRNLLANAAAAVESSGAPEPIKLRLELVGDRYRLRVEDRGPGLPAGPPDRLFDPFVSGRPGGAGLGLALSRRIALLHAGSLTLENRPGGGVSAILELAADTSDTEGSSIV